MSWRALAACATSDVDFYPERYAHAGLGHRSALTPDVLRAKAVCATCPVQPECLAYALDADEPSGIWGGLTPDERRALR